MEETPAHFRQKAKQCRRLAAEIVDQNDPAVRALLALADEYEAKSAARLADPGGA
jgi:hypothetical protein